MFLWFEIRSSCVLRIREEEEERQDGGVSLQIDK
jgi:hypothetical protein